MLKSSENIEMIHMENKLENIKINCLNDSILEFQGILLSNVNDEYKNGKNQSRWNEHQLYKMKEGKYLIYTQDITRWQGEENNENYTIFQNLEELNEYVIENNSNLLYLLMKEANLTIIINL